MSHDHAELWKLFESTDANTFPDFLAWCAGLPESKARLGVYYASKGDSSWWAETWRTFKGLRERGVLSYVSRNLALPEARKLSDLFEAARFIRTLDGGHYRHEFVRHRAEACGGPGFLGCSGAEGVAPCRNIYARKVWAPAGHRRCEGAGGFWATYAKPKPEVWKAWGGDAADQGDFGLSGFEFVERDDGILVIACTYSGFGKRWFALLDADQSLESMMPPGDVETLRADRAADLAAWGSHREKPEGWAQWIVTGTDRADNAIGEFEPFSIVVGAANEGEARDTARAVRYALGRDHVSTHTAAPLNGAAPPAAPGPGQAISPDVLRVLRAAETEGDALRLTGQLDRALYLATDKVLRTQGGRWDSKRRVHVFDGDAGEILGAVLATGRYVDAKKVLQAFYTPSDLAARVIEAARIEPGMTVLEPSAGGGALARPARDAGALVTCMEVDDKAAAKLEAEGFVCAVGDFLTEPPDHFDRVVMNPPFSGGQDVRHVVHAARFVRPGGRLVAIMAPGFQFRDSEPFRSFRDWLNAKPHTITEIAAGAFAESGTNVATLLVAVDL